jgi:hypothetical protein
MKNRNTGRDGWVKWKVHEVLRTLIRIVRGKKQEHWKGWVGKVEGA